MGNALADARTVAASREGIVAALSAARIGATPMLAEHIDWALAQCRSSQGPMRLPQN
jgi:hypothetical protein